MTSKSHSASVLYIAEILLVLDCDIIGSLRPMQHYQEVFLYKTQSSWHLLAGQVTTMLSNHMMEVLIGMNHRCHLVQPSTWSTIANTTSGLLTFFLQSLQNNWGWEFSSLSVQSPSRLHYCLWAHFSPNIKTPSPKLLPVTTAMSEFVSPTKKFGSMFICSSRHCRLPLDVFSALSSTD